MTLSGKLLSLYRTCQTIRTKNVLLVSSLNHHRRLKSTDVDVQRIEECKNEEELSTRHRDRQGYVEGLVHSAVNSEDLSNEKSCTTFDKNYDVELAGPLDECTEDLSYIAPYAQLWTFSTHINSSETVKRLVDLDVNLHKIRKKNPSIIKEILQLRFEQDVQPRISFLLKLDVPLDEIGQFITTYPQFLTGNMEDFITRVRYLEAHKFSESMITTILRKYPRWLSFNTKVVDGRLCFIQNKYNLDGSTVRSLIEAKPNLVSLEQLQMENIHFTLERVLGLEMKNIKGILINTPGVWLRSMTELTDTYNYAFFDMGLSAEYIAQHSEILLCRISRLQTRHEFLVHLGRAQYDPTKPLYVSPATLCSESDTFFCNKVANTSVLLYDAFLKMI